jgi:hypothetical protein
MNDVQPRIEAVIERDRDRLFLQTASSMISRLFRCPARFLAWELLR